VQGAEGLFLQSAATIPPWNCALGGHASNNTSTSGACYGPSGRDDWRNERGSIFVDSVSPQSHDAVGPSRSSTGAKALERMRLQSLSPLTAAMAIGHEGRCARHDDLAVLDHFHTLNVCPSCLPRYTNAVCIPLFEHV
jgi:hypothetical protein